MQLDFSNLEKLFRHDSGKDDETREDPLNARKSASMSGERYAETANNTDAAVKEGTVPSSQSYPSRTDESAGDALENGFGGGDPEDGEARAVPDQSPEADKRSAESARTGIEEIDIDIETFSDEDIADCGVYKYAESAGFKILLFSYSVNGSSVITIDLASGERIPDEILMALSDETVVKWAFNCPFERICLSAYLKKNYPEYFHPDDEGFLSPRSWHCSKVWSSYLGLPSSLAKAGAALRIDKEKLEEGKDLIHYFCEPCRRNRRAGGTDNGEVRNLPESDPEKWNNFKKYNRRDVEAEEEIRGELSQFPVPESVWEEFYLDQKINDTGVGTDAALIGNAIPLNNRIHEDLENKLKELTGVENPNSRLQMLAWLNANGFKMTSLDKKHIAEAVDDVEDPAVKKVLLLIQENNNSSNNKYEKMAKAVCADGRLRGMFVFYGASRTGRFTSTIVQLQNIPRNHLRDLEGARNLLLTGDYESITAKYDNPLDFLSQLIRTALIPEPGERFFIADFSSIEARVSAWLAGERWKMEAFHNGEDIYCKSASSMFGVPVEKNGINGELRQKGKIAELACAYGGGLGAMMKMGAAEAGLTEKDMKDILAKWKKANPNIVRLWDELDRAVRKTVIYGDKTNVKGIGFRNKDRMLVITLPSGRELFYRNPKIEKNRYGGTNITYEEYKNGNAIQAESYGPRFLENIVQGISRDILCYAMRALDACGYRIVAHVHDEVVIEASVDASLDEICRVMGQTPPWAEGLELRADGFISDYYRKDN